MGETLMAEAERVATVHTPGAADITEESGRGAGVLEGVQQRAHGIGAYDLRSASHQLLVTSSEAKQSLEATLSEGEATLPEAVVAAASDP